MANYQRSLAKKVAISLGLCPNGRLLYRHLINRNSLAAYRTKLEFFRQFIGKNDLVFDIGANCGALTEVFLDLGAKVVACEPQSDCLRELVARQANRHRLIASNCALGSARGTAKFYVRAPNPGTSGFIADWHDHIAKVLEVETVTLDDLIERHGPPKYCKIDVEGYELEVLKGLTETIPLVSFEYHIRPESDIAKSMECLNYLSRFGNLAINVTPAEDFRFLFDGWVAKDYFVEFLTKHINKLSGFYYGDIFVSTHEH